jgi:transposase
VQLIEENDATLLFLPPYSPDLNPIEYDSSALMKNREYQEHAAIEENVTAYQ